MARRPKTWQHQKITISLNILWDAVLNIYVPKRQRSMYSDSVTYIGRPVATGGGEGGGLSPPWKNLSPPLGCIVPFVVTIGNEVYPPWSSVSPPLLTIPGYGAEHRHKFLMHYGAVVCVRKVYHTLKQTTFI